jgi:hypothetical protein
MGREDILTVLLVPSVQKEEMHVRMQHRATQFQNEELVNALDGAVRGKIALIYLRYLRRVI